MRIGVPKEIKIHEYRVGLVPSSVKELTRLGHDVFIEKNAGTESGFSDDAYIQAGAQMLQTADEVFQTADLIVKVKEPQESEYKKLRKDQVLFTYLHLAPDPKQAQALIESGCVGIAYETVTDSNGGLPLLAPMSEVAGRMAIQVGAWALEKHQGGSGVLLGGVPGVKPGKVTIIGGGVVGTQAAKIALGTGADVTLLDRNVNRLRILDEMFHGHLKTLYSNFENIEMSVEKSDLVVGAVLIAGGAAPKLVSEKMLHRMRKGSVLVDVAIDQGGCFETSRPTTHQDPIYDVHGIKHYCVANIPGAVARTSALALNNATLPFVLALANKGYMQAILDDKHLMNGLNVHAGHITHKVVADALNMSFKAFN